MGQLPIKYFQVNYIYLFPIEEIPVLLQEILKIWESSFFFFQFSNTILLFPNFFQFRNSEKREY